MKEKVEITSVNPAKEAFHSSNKALPFLSLNSNYSANLAYYSVLNPTHNSIE